jgi:hypothetical protein
MRRTGDMRRGKCLQHFSHENATGMVPSLLVTSRLVPNTVNSNYPDASYPDRQLSGSAWSFT